ncbi:hypothetical protein GXM_07661 [Nostoc sphaeroides CCNUC1]|uniref:Uncharacterized protein n=1 Tax=Nostoc sphaeroides CCNUC1 TaxID=2653204 RepID=A0A5P8WBK8_9NOSO|nr:hypothetical protein GXM_07661 [Nostoc sphaeroides CCNUC1]
MKAIAYIEFMQIEVHPIRQIMLLESGKRLSLKKCKGDGSGRSQTLKS